MVRRWATSLSGSCRDCPIETRRTSVWLDEYGHRWSLAVSNVDTRQRSIALCDIFWYGRTPLCWGTLHSLPPSFSQLDNICRTAQPDTPRNSFGPGHTQRYVHPAYTTGIRTHTNPSPVHRPISSPTYPNALEHPDGELQRHGIPAAHPGKRAGDPEVQGRVSRLALREGLAQPPQSVDPLACALRRGNR